MIKLRGLVNMCGHGCEPASVGYHGLGGDR